MTRLLVGETDATNSYVTDTQVNDAINNAKDVVASELRNNLTSAYFTTVAGTREYGLPTDLMQLTMAEVNDGTATYKLRRRTLHEFATYFSGFVSSNTGRPSDYHAEFGATVVTDADQVPGSIEFYPTPDSNGGSNYTVTLHYYQRMTTLVNDTDVSELPLESHMAVVYQAAAYVALNMDNSNKASEMMALYARQMESASDAQYMADRSGPFQALDTMGYSDDDTAGGVI